MQSAILTEFYTAYLLWLLMGAPQNDVIVRRHGLCENLRRWLFASGIEDNTTSQEMCNQLETELRSCVYPFGGAALFGFETRTHTMHRNPMRNQWIVDHVDREIYPDQSPSLTLFYRHWCAWVNDGAPEYNSNGFSRSEGLCSSLVSWADRHCLPMSHLTALKTEIKQQFKDAGLDVAYPWGSQEFDYCCDSAQMHTDTKRVIWARDHAR